MQLVNRYNIWAVVDICNVLREYAKHFLKSIQSKQTLFSLKGYTLLYRCMYDLKNKLCSVFVMVHFLCFYCLQFSDY